MSSHNPRRLGGLVLVALVLLLGLVVSVAVNPFTGIVTAARAVLVAFVVSRALLVVCGTARTAGEFLAGVGGLLYVLGLFLDQSSAVNTGGTEDYSFLLRSVGLGLSVMPLVLEYIPESARLIEWRLKINQKRNRR